MIGHFNEFGLGEFQKFKLKSRLKYPLMDSSVDYIGPVSRGLSSKGLIFEACVDMCVHYHISAFVTLTNSATVNSLCMALKRSQVIWHMMILWCCIFSLGQENLEHLASRL